MDLRFTGLLQPRCVLNLSHSTEKLNQIEKGERSIAKVSLRGEPVGIEGEADDFVCGYFVSKELQPVRWFDHIGRQLGSVHTAGSFVDGSTLCVSCTENDRYL